MLLKVELQLKRSLDNSVLHTCITLLTVAMTVNVIPSCQRLRTTDTNNTVARWATVQLRLSSVPDFHASNCPSATLSAKSLLS